MNCGQNRKQTKSCSSGRFTGDHRRRCHSDPPGKNELGPNGQISGAKSVRNWAKWIGGIARTGDVYPRFSRTSFHFICGRLYKNELRMSSETETVCTIPYMYMYLLVSLSLCIHYSYMYHIAEESECGSQTHEEDVNT